MTNAAADYYYTALKIYQKSSIFYLNQIILHFVVVSILKVASIGFFLIKKEVKQACRSVTMLESFKHSCTFYNEQRTFYMVQDKAVTLNTHIYIVH